ncbi:MAG: 30S ribosomal protein S13 [Candidatus Wallbacteria bacterium]
MARISGVDLPKNKRMEVAMTYIYGIGLTTSQKLLTDLSIDFNKKVKDLTEEEIVKIREYIEKNLRVEGDLRRELITNIKRLQDINCYRGIRHRKSLPVRGQRTHTNARTRKGPRKTVGAKRTATKK